MPKPVRYPKTQYNPERATKELIASTTPDNIGEVAGNLYALHERLAAVATRAAEDYSVAEQRYYDRPEVYKQKSTEETHLLRVLVNHDDIKSDSNVDYDKHISAVSGWVDEHLDVLTKYAITDAAKDGIEIQTEQ